MFVEVVENLMKERFSHVKGTIMRGATSLNYVHMVLLPVLSALYEHFGHNNFGTDLIGTFVAVNNNNGYLECLTCTGHECLHSSHKPACTAYHSTAQVLNSALVCKNSALVCQTGVELCT